MTDIRYALRVLRKTPGFTFIALVSLALGIGATTAIFSIVNAVLLRPLPWGDADRLVAINATVRRDRIERRSLSYPDFEDWRAQSTAFAALSANSGVTFTVTGNDVAERIDGELASAEYFDILAIEPIRGRRFTVEEDREIGKHPVALISHSLWQRRFGGDEQAIGRQIPLNNQAFTVIGILPEGFRGIDDDTDIWIPMGMMETSVPAQRRTSRGSRWMGAIGLLAKGVTVERAQSELNTIAARLAQEHPRTNEHYGAEVRSLHDAFFATSRAMLLTLLAAVFFVLLIACANVANLMLVRASGRQRETAVRVALGAGRRRLMRLYLAETTIIALAGGLLGLLFAGWGVDVLLWMSPQPLPSFVRAGIDARVLAVAAGLSALTGLTLGMAPAVQAWNPRIGETLKQGGRSNTGGRALMRSALVVSEVALALLLLVGAGLMIQSFRAMQQIDLGFEPAGRLTFRIGIPAAKYGERLDDAYRRILERVRAVPGVRTAALATDVPLGGSSSAIFATVEGEADQPDSMQRTRLYTHGVDPAYFEAAGIRVIKGRGFTTQDTADSPEVIVVDERAAARYWPGEDPIGKRVKPGSLTSDSAWMTVVGVVPTVRHRAIVADPAADPSDPDIYAPLAQDRTFQPWLVVQSAQDPASLTAALRGAIRAVDPDIPVYDVQTMEALVANETGQTNLAARMMAMFGGVALLLAAIGVYGVINYSVSQRRQELAVRMALGARPGDVFALVLRQGAWLSAVGVGVGLVTAFWLTRYMAGQLYAISPTDPVTLGAVGTTLILVAVVASAVPARRATRVDPIEALRTE